MACSTLKDSGMSWTSDVCPEGPLPQFLQMKPRLTCCKCRQVLQSPVQTQCGHRLCQSCVRDILCKEDPPRCPAMQENCVVLKEAEIYPDHAAHHEVCGLQVYCPYKKHGCQEYVAWKQLQAHVDKCMYVLVNCTRKSLGCEQMVCDVDLEHHLGTDCEYRPEPCPHCQIEVPRKKLEEHVAHQCLDVELPCPYKCGEVPIVRKMMEEHKETCGSRPTDCQFRHIGCQFQCKAMDMNQHIQDDIANHLQLNTAENSQLKQMLDRHSQTLTQNSQALAQMTQILNKQADNIDNQAETINKQAETIEKQDKVIEELSTEMNKNLKHQEKEHNKGTEELQRKFEQKLERWASG